MTEYQAGRATALLDRPDDCAVGTFATIALSESEAEIPWPGRLVFLSEGDGAGESFGIETGLFRTSAFPLCTRSRKVE